MKGKILLLAGAALLGACSSSNEAENGQLLANAPDANLAAPADNVATPGNEAESAPAIPGFDASRTPVAAEPALGAWPYFSIIDGYTRMTRENAYGDSSKEFLRDAAFDRYEFWDGFKLIPVEGRRVTYRAKGKGASFFQVQKTYEKLVKDLGGVTVFEGTGESMETAKQKFAEGSHRGRYMLKSDQMGVYIVRTPTRELWVEVYKPWEVENDDYWITVVEKKGLEMKAKMLDAEQMKSALDATGHVALYINFDTDKTAIKPDAQPTIAEIVKLMTDNPGVKLEVQGHTDNQGDAAHNMTLSSGRANSVVGALMAAGIPLDRLSPKGYGQTKPIADNGTEDGRAKNRRVELVKK
jgi:outer membrane protein OmpA-like peptidoglycan-associated protein